MARSCLFCGSSEDLNREHIFPEWLLKCLDVYHDEAYVYRADEDHPRRKLTYNNLVAKKFCKSCNEGWMKRLEDRVNPLLTQTLESRTSHQLSDDEAQALSCMVHKNGIYTFVLCYLRDKATRALSKGFPANWSLRTYISIGHFREPLTQPSWFIGTLPFFDLPPSSTPSFFRSEVSEEEVVDLNNSLNPPKPKVEQADPEKAYMIAFGFGNFGARVWHVPKPLRWFDAQVEYNVFLHPRQKDVVWIHPYSFNNFQEYHSRVSTNL